MNIQRLLSGFIALALFITSAESLAQQNANQQLEQQAAYWQHRQQMDRRDEEMRQQSYLRNLQLQLRRRVQTVRIQTQRHAQQLGRALQLDRLRQLASGQSRKRFR